MQIYHYHPLTREHLGSSQADPDPLTEGGWLVPANATTDPPPKVGPDQATVYGSGEWLLLPDYRGKTAYDTATKAEVLVEDLGELPAALTLLPPGRDDTWTGSAWALDTEDRDARIQRQLTQAIQTLLDTEAQKHRYDNIHTAVGWADLFVDAAALKTWGAACWITSGEIEAEVMAGNREIPTVAELLAAMPVFGA